MTYCVAMRLNQGLVFLADSRTNAGVDQISTFRKLTVFENPGERVLVMLSAGNLAITQAVRQIICEAPAVAEAGTPGNAAHEPAAPTSVWQARSLFDAVRLVGDAVRVVFRHDRAALEEAGIDFHCSFLFGGQIRGEPMRLFHVYAAGNFIEATPENPYFQIGESKYGKPIVDRVITPETSLGEGAKCALISMDSTLRSNISVGLPLDLLVYEADSLRVTKFVHIDEDNEYMQMIRSTWGRRLRQVFSEIPDPAWRDTPPGSGAPRLETRETLPVRAPRPPAPASTVGSGAVATSTPLATQTLAQQLPAGKPSE
jgi:putative proteasome-type protease